MINAKMLYDFMTHFDLARTDVTMNTDGYNIWFEKPSGEQCPLEFSLFEDGSYAITIFKDKLYGEVVILEEGKMRKGINDETDLQSHAKDA